MRISKIFPINLSIESIDMHKWVLEMTPAEYETFAPAHQAMGSFFRGERGTDRQRHAGAALQADKLQQISGKVLLLQDERIHLSMAVGKLWRSVGNDGTAYLRPIL